MNTPYLAVTSLSFSLHPSVKGLFSSSASLKLVAVDRLV